jgi:hypothetical protein
MALTQTQAIIGIVGGSVMIVLSLTAKQFYAARGVFGVTVSNRKIPTWQGRLLFLVVGIVMFAFGLSFFFYDH